MRRPKLEELTLREKIGQLLMIDQLWLVKMMEINEDIHPMRSEEEVENIMTKYQYGSVWAKGAARVGAANETEYIAGEKATAEEHKRWIEKVSKNVKIPLLAGADCAGGASVLFADGAPTVNALAIGAANDEGLAYELTKSVCREIKAAGVNWRWQPILDVRNRFMGVGVGRTVSDNIEKIKILASAIVRGTEDAKVATTVKHFPGCDPYEFRDSHLVTTCLNISIDEWEEMYGKTYKHMIDMGVMSVMVTHCAFPAIDDEKIGETYIPSTMSSKVIEGLLREKLGFNGVVITDAIEMGSLASMCSHEELLIRTINAGNDILLGVKPYDAEIVYQAVMDGKIPMKRIDESCERVLLMKEKIGLFDDAQEELDIKEECKNTMKINAKVAEKSMTLLRNRQKLIPVSKDKIKKVAIICSTHSEEPAEVVVGTMKEEFEKRGAMVTLRDGWVMTSAIEVLAKENDLLVYVGYVAPHIPMGMPSLYGRTVQTYMGAFTVGKEKSIGVSLGYPYLHYDVMQGADTFINTYTPSKGSQIALVKAIYGEISCEGESPVDIEPKIRGIRC